MEAHAARRPGLGDADFGRELLNRIAPRRSLREIASIGHFNAAVLKEIYGTPGPAIQLMMQTGGTRFAAANLCGHHGLPNATCLTIIERLMAASGDVVNQFVPASQRVKGVRV